ncbi:DUF932 domain-containing protein [Tautonia sociabilis]|uniref:DUF932 domain-containing protein n=1 Tax=Tautonia sociabilis TaxID=2080755 RepID=A0A432MLB2_9BACT|nr:DUF932 domain-containing protein [Tautonia sociabilis]RUL87997.1 DUF932 domain-containing protein [Tautonia sociabilis]
MTNLTHAHRELFRRTPDQIFPTLQALWEHCQAQKERSTDRWRPPQAIRPGPDGGRLVVDLGDGNEPFALNDWSFGQLCSIARVSKETVNRVSADTASRVLQETLPAGNKPLQVFTEDDLIRSIHGHTYTRLHDVEVVTMLREFAVDFRPPQEGTGGGTGLYCGEQDLFAFLIDPTGWAEIDGQAFAPGFFVWNSEVGRRSVGISTFWFQAVCRNHIVWDATEVVEFTRKHTGRVGEALGDIRSIVETLVETRDARRDGFVAVVRKAMESKLGEDAEEVMKVLTRSGITRALARRAIEIAGRQGRFTVFALVDALTRLARELPNAGDRTEADQRASSLLALAAS